VAFFMFALPSLLLCSLVVMAPENLNPNDPATLIFLSQPEV
jgi:hypothetical protein